MNSKKIVNSIAILGCMLLILASACQSMVIAQAYPAPSALIPTETGTPSKTPWPIYTWNAPKGGKIPTVTIMPTSTPIPASWNIYQLSKSGIVFRYPEDWQIENASRYSGKSGFFEASLRPYKTTIFGNLRTMCVLEANLHKTDLYGSMPTVIMWSGLDREGQNYFGDGCGVIPSEDAPQGGEAVLFAQFDPSALADQILVLRTDPLHFLGILKTIRLETYVAPTPHVEQEYTSPLCVLTGMERAPVVTHTEGLTVTEYPIVDAACHPYDHLDSFQRLIPWQAQRPDAKWYKWEDIHRADDSHQVQVGKDTIRWQDNDTHTFPIGAPTQYDIFRNDQVIMTISIPLYSPGGGPVRDLWTWQDHWILEVEAIVIMDGVIQNQSLGYEEMFNWHLVDEHPFYFFRQKDTFGMAYDGQTLPLHYDQIIHGFLCCDPARYSIWTAPIGAMFYAQRDGVWWFVEVKADG